MLAELAGVLEDVAARARDPRPRGAPRPRSTAGAAIDELARELDEALVVGRETALLAPPRRRTLRTVDLYADAAAQIDLAVRNVRVLARGARRAIDLDENVPPGGGRRAALARRRRCARSAARSTTRRRPTRSASRRSRAASKATLVLEGTGNLSVSVIVGQIRSTAVDLLRGSGMSFEEAVDGGPGGRARGGGRAPTPA